MVVLTGAAAVCINSGAARAAMRRRVVLLMLGDILSLSSFFSSVFFVAEVLFDAGKHTGLLLYLHC